MPQKPIFVAVDVIPKEVLVGRACAFHRLGDILSVIPKEGLAQPGTQSSFWYDNNKDLKRQVFAACDSHNIIICIVGYFMTLLLVEICRCLKQSGDHV